MLNDSNWCSSAFSRLCYIIIDEFHVFIGDQRGYQLQSLLHRLDFLINRKVPRIALSATLGDLDQVAKFLRPDQNLKCEIIESNLTQTRLKVKLYGHCKNDNDNDFDEFVSQQLYGVLRGKSNLVFANSRSATENISSKLRYKSKINNVPNEFFPHHGSLAKHIRENLEQRLQREDLPTAAVCTATLELGIDIGNVDSVAQVGEPHSVSALRQRIGRSGRRGVPAVLRMFVSGKDCSSSDSFASRLQLEIFQSISVVSLLLDRWYETDASKTYNFSTLTQQCLSVIGQYGGVRAHQLYSLLCVTGPFRYINETLFLELLRGLGANNLIQQLHDGQLILGKIGSQIVGKYDFYSTFTVAEEFYIQNDGKALGTVPLSKGISIDRLIAFSGRYWVIKKIFYDKKRL